MDNLEWFMMEKLFVMENPKKSEMIWGYPDRWMVYFLENPSMMMSKETFISCHGSSVFVCVDVRCSHGMLKEQKNGVFFSA